MKIANVARQAANKLAWPKATMPQIVGMLGATLAHSAAAFVDLHDDMAYLGHPAAPHVVYLVATFFAALFFTGWVTDELLDKYFPKAD